MLTDQAAAFPTGHRSDRLITGTAVPVPVCRWSGLEENHSGPNLVGQLRAVVIVVLPTVEPEPEGSGFDQDIKASYASIEEPVHVFPCCHLPTSGRFFKPALEQGHGFDNCRIRLVGEDNGSSLFDFLLVFPAAYPSPLGAAVQLVSLAVIRTPLADSVAGACAACVRAGPLVVGVDVGLHGAALRFGHGVTSWWLLRWKLRDVVPGMQAPTQEQTEKTKLGPCTASVGPLLEMRGLPVPSNLRGLYGFRETLIVSAFLGAMVDTRREQLQAAHKIPHMLLAGYPGWLHAVQADSLILQVAPCLLEP